MLWDIPWRHEAEVGVELQDQVLLHLEGDLCQVCKMLHPPGTGTPYAEARVLSAPLNAAETAQQELEPDPEWTHRELTHTDYLDLQEVAYEAVGGHALGKGALRVLALLRPPPKFREEVV